MICTLRDMQQIATPADLSTFSPMQVPALRVTRLPDLDIDTGNVATLEQLADDVKREHAAVTTATRKGIPHAKAAGDKLREAKARLGHGRYTKWLATTGVPGRTARLYTLLASGWSHIADDIKAGKISGLNEAASEIGRRTGRTRAKPKVATKVAAIAKSLERLLADVNDDERDDVVAELGRIKSQVDEFASPENR